LYIKEERKISTTVLGIKPLCLRSVANMRIVTIILMATDAEVPVSLAGATRFSEK
jgi:hypothetical protein